MNIISKSKIIREFTSRDLAYFRAREFLVIGLSAIAMLVAMPAVAQENDLPVGRVDDINDDNGLSFIEGDVTVTDPGVEIGELDHGGMAYNRFYKVGPTSPWNWGYSYNYHLSRSIEETTDPHALTVITVTKDKDATPFIIYSGSPYSTYVSEKAGGEALVEDSTKFTFVDRDGTVIYFDKSYQNLATMVKRPNGEVLNFYYNYIGTSPATGRLRSVQSNFGYQLRLDYSSNDMYALSRVYIVNDAVEYCNPALSFCTGLSQNWPYKAYSVSTSSSTLPLYRTDTTADFAGNAKIYTTYEWYYGRIWAQLTSRSSGPSGSESVNYTFSDSSNPYNAIIGPDGAWKYAGATPSAGSDPNSPPGAGYKVTRIAPSGAVTMTYVSTHPRVILSLTDPNGRTTNYLYDSFHRLSYVVPPEGTITNGVPTAGYTQNLYDVRGNVTMVRKVPKTGSNLPTLVYQAGYDATCSNVYTCNKPNWIKDPNGNQTDYRYDANHGGILSEMKPPVSVSGGTSTVRPLTLTTWTQRYSWIKNSTGGLVQAPTPIWLVSTVTECQTSSSDLNTPACDSSARQIVTTYEYGSSGTRESLLVKGVAVTVDGATTRTCYGYDIYNHKVSKINPNANLGACP